MMDKRAMEDGLKIVAKDIIIWVYGKMEYLMVKEW